MIRKVQVALMAKLTLEEKVNRQVKAANKRHGATLERLAALLEPEARAADDNASVLYAESFAEAIVTYVAAVIKKHKATQIGAVLSGKLARPMNPPAGTVLISERRMNELSDDFGYAEQREKYFALTGVSFVDLLNQRLASAHGRKLIPPCSYDGQKVSVTGAAE